MSKEKDKRKYPVNFYLKESKRPVQIQRMMKDLFRGQVKTLEEWENADNQINNRRC